MRDGNYCHFCAAVSSYLKCLGAVDALVLVMKGTLGESHIVSRELMHQLLYRNPRSPVWMCIVT